MSPTEDELRSALRSGEGPGLDPDAVIRHAQARGTALHDRRVRLASAAAVVAVVAGLGVGSGIALSRHTDTRSAGGLSNGKAVEPEPAVGNAAGSSAGAATGPVYSTPAACPPTMPVPNTPARGTDSLFPGVVAAIDVCLYSNGPQLEPIGGTTHQPNLVISGTQMRQLITSIDSASPTEQPLPCPLYRTASAVGLVLIGVHADGSTLAPVSTQYRQNPCNLAITNGTAVRYNWQPPASFTAELDQTLTKLGHTR